MNTTFNMRNILVNTIAKQLSNDFIVREDKLPNSHWYTIVCSDLSISFFIGFCGVGAHIGTPCDTIEFGAGFLDDVTISIYDPKMIDKIEIYVQHALKSDRYRAIM